MNGERFTIDANILVYFVHAPAGERHGQAVSIIERAARCDCWLTLQAISEFYVATTRKGLISPQQAAAQAQDWLEIFPTTGHSEISMRIALAAAVDRRASYWDALLCASAAEAGCRAILTEDLRHGDILSGVRVVHPFRGDTLTAEAAALLAA